MGNTRMVALMTFLSLMLMVVMCQTQGQIQGGATTQTQSQGRQGMNPFMSMMLMRTLDNFFPWLYLMNQGGMGGGGLMGGGLFPLLAFNML